MNILCFTLKYLWSLSEVKEKEILCDEAAEISKDESRILKFI